MNNRDIIWFSLFTLITVLLWMVFEVVHTSQKSTISLQVNQQIKPIVPSFDTKVLRELKSRKNL